MRDAWFQRRDSRTSLWSAGKVSSAKAQVLSIVGATVGDLHGTIASAELVPTNNLLAALMNEETYQPVPPPSLIDAGLSESLVDSLLTKFLLAKGRATGKLGSRHRGWAGSPAVVPDKEGG